MGERKKIVQTYWYDGKKLCSWGRLNIIYGLHHAMKPENINKPILIHEGAKCAKIGHDNLTSFCNVSYNRGSSNSDKPDWSVFADRDVYILPDYDNAGIAAALKIMEKLPQSVPVSGMYFAMGIKKKGADIEDLLDAGVPVAEIERWIFGCEVRGL